MLPAARLAASGRVRKPKSQTLSVGRRATAERRLRGRVRRSRAGGGGGRADQTRSRAQRHAVWPAAGHRVRHLVRGRPRSARRPRRSPLPACDDRHRPGVLVGDDGGLRAGRKLRSVLLGARRRRRRARRGLPAAGAPGTIITFLAWPDAAPGRLGVGETEEPAF